MTSEGPDTPGALLERAAEQYEIYLELSRISHVAAESEEVRAGELLIDTQRHPVGLVLHHSDH